MRKVKYILAFILSAVLFLCLGINLISQAQRQYAYAESTKIINSSKNLEEISDGDVIQLHATINLASPIIIENNVTLDLNGQNIFNVNGSVIMVRNGGNLTIEDTSQNSDGAISNGKGYEINGETYGGGVLIESGGSVIFKSGAITSNSATYGGGVFVDNGASFEMQGGDITGNNPSTESAGKFGGGVYVVDGGTFIMNGGSVSGNKATIQGAGVYVAGDIKICGKQYIGNNGLTDGTINNLFLTDDNKITVTGTLIAADETEPNISVTLETYYDAREITSGYGTYNMESEDEAVDPVNFFGFDDTDYSVAEFNYEFAVPAMAMTLPSFATDLVITIISRGGTYGAVVPAVAIESNGVSVAFIYTYSGVCNDGTVYGPRERVPDKAGTYKVYVTTQDPNYNLQETSADFIISRAQITKPTEATTELDYKNLPVEFIATSDGTNNKVIASLTDKYNYEWSDGTTADVVISVTPIAEGNTATPNSDTDDTAKTALVDDSITNSNFEWLWLIVAFAVILVIAAIIVVTYWINRAKKAERLNEDLMKNNNNKTFVAAPGLLAISYLMIGVIGVIALIAVAIVVILVLHIVSLYKSKKDDVPEEEEKEETPAYLAVKENDAKADAEPEQMTMIPEEEPQEEYEPAPIIYDTFAEEPSISDYYSYYHGEEDDGPYEAVGEEGIPADAIKVPEQLSILDDNGEVEEVLNSVDEKSGTAYVVRYKKSFMARLIQSWDDSKEYYEELKNEIMSYRSVKSRISWNYDCISVGDTAIIKIDVRGKTLCLYYALTPEDYDNTKYKVERTQIKKCEDTPCLYRMKNPTRVANAKELIAKIAKNYGLEKTMTRKDKYEYPYETTAALVNKGLAKEYLVKEKYDEFIDNSNKSKAKNIDHEKQNKRRKEIAKVVKMRRKEIKSDEVNSIIADDLAADLVIDERNGKTYSGKKDIVNIDTLSANYESGEIVTKDNLIEKGLIPKSATAVKVLARGMLTKPLTVEAQDFSLEAVKMIALTGGSAVKV